MRKRDLIYVPFLAAVMIFGARSLDPLFPSAQRAQLIPPVRVLPSPPRPTPTSQSETGSGVGDGGHDRHLVDAIIRVESGGDSAAVGDGGRAVGVLQIHPIMVRECNRILGREEFTLTDRLDPERSRLMFWTYADHYSKNATRQTIARRWNGGPDGDTEPATVSYWRKVKAILDEQARTETGDP